MTDPNNGQKRSGAGGSNTESAERRRRSSTREIAILVVVGAVLIVWLGIPTVNKYEADRKVYALCARDGGLKIYETIRWPRERFDEFGNPMLHSGNRTRAKERTLPGDELYTIAETTWLTPEKHDSLEMLRVHQTLVRLADGKVLGEATSYVRRGGDPLGPWHPSSYVCPVNADIGQVIRRAVVPQ